MTLLGSMTTSVRAEANPYYLGISQSLGHNSNLYHAENNEVPDKFAVTSLHGGFDQPIGRQRAFADVSVHWRRYEDIRILDNTGYGLNAGLDWSTIERLSGSFGVASNRVLANYAATGNQQQVPETKKNMETARRLLVNAQIVNGVPQGPIEGRENVTSVRLGANCAASRIWHLGCNAGQDAAKPSSPSSGRSTQYTVTQASCNVQDTIR
jgi:hypothetical protein